MNTRRTALALALVLPLGLAACGSAEPEAPTAAPAMTSSAPTTTGSSSATSAATTDPAAQVFGSACSAVPSDGKGSFSGMATDPVATAASNNPLLSTLVTAVTEAGLVDTLNSAPDVTVFAPVNDAFAKIPEADLKAVLADKPTLTKILTNHVVAGSLSPDELAGTHETLAGTTLTVEPSGDSFTVGKERATVLCGNVPTANATVYIIDTVLMP
ncbi:fasciclin domain-containing protein [Intrasporangium calvum]|uniref:Beta-Ig-H3/fasciclin n=1 Tax=Intrasporangium calvum (strain ATCC 23552 / DSM 43043 / JCM 3097 / NBRC 12989 / NCIMB 10167 / NRRL B-3866 / 7 KIP) TaxID=710696 RepID=E6SEQ2_INTC7|nr:fasciclin domain-containing protein [Intrasporangium calvum]ADU46653.1 beta-Ig-H3/fasciclin [Intrasporangium calvum DSM 43043]AXG15528.1 fasciclin domain-containing protein [Intrasporangium calvum]